MANDLAYQGYKAKTADFTITEAENGTTFTNRGAAGAVVATLPAPFANGHYRFLVRAAQTFTIAAPTADTLVADNDATADSVAASRVGAMIEVVSDGTEWFAFGIASASNITVNT